MRCLLFMWEAVWGEDTKHDNNWCLSELRLSQRGRSTHWCADFGQTTLGPSLLLEPACTTSKVPFVPAPADIIFSIKTYRAFDIRTAPSRQHGGSNKEQATIADTPCQTPNPDFITGGLDSRAVCILTNPFKGPQPRHQSLSSFL